MYQLTYKITEKELTSYSNIGNPTSATESVNIRIIEKNTPPVFGSSPEDI
jgi:hypothetical protein